MADTSLEKPLISIIIPLYNKAPFISRALDSVLSQTIQNFEIIVIGGKSSDGGENIVLQYSDPRIIFVKERGIGVSAARNQGVGVARADLVTFLDADDEWLPKFLETILRMRDKWPNAGIYATSRYIESQQSKSHIVPIISKGLPKKWEGVIHPIFRYASKHGFPGSTSSTCIPKEIFYAVGGFIEGISRGEDTELFGRISLTYPYVFSTDNLVIYHSDDIVSLMRQPGLGQMEEHPFQKSIKSLSVYDGLIYEKDLRLYLESLSFIIIDNNIAVGNYSNAKKHLLSINSKFYFRKKYLLKLFQLYAPDKVYIHVRYLWRKIKLK